MYWNIFMMMSMVDIQTTDGVDEAGNSAEINQKTQSMNTKHGAWMEKQSMAAMAHVQRLESLGPGSPQCMSNLLHKVENRITDFACLSRRAD
jgi:hypothetical protein